MESALTCDMPTSSLAFSSACTPLKNFLGQAWDSPLSGVSYIATVEGFGQRLRWTKEPRFTLRFRRPVRNRHRRANLLRGNHRLLPHPAVSPKTAPLVILNRLPRWVSSVT